MGKSRFHKHTKFCHTFKNVLGNTYIEKMDTTYGHCNSRKQAKNICKTKT